MSAITPQQFLAFQHFIENRSGVSLGENKQYLVQGRLSQVMARYDIADYAQLLCCLNAPRYHLLQQEVVEVMTTNETSWFRDNRPFELLKQVILPQLTQQAVGPYRIWSAACSSGQEAYSISMTLESYLANAPDPMLAQTAIVGTDISAQVIEQARSGIYSDMVMQRGLSRRQQQAYFQPTEQGFQVSSDIKKRVSFTVHNLLTSFAPLGLFDVIFCRNVLMYFSPELKSAILNRIAQAMRPNGYLLLGSSESPLGDSDVFKQKNSEHGIYFQRG